VRSLKILPILDTSLTTPLPTKTAQTCTADASTSGAESLPNEGVNAAAMGAWCCWSSSDPSKSGSADAAKRYDMSGSAHSLHQSPPHSPR
jgi:hypothetical protein